MRRRNRDSAETSSHPFRSLFDLMVALVFLLLAFVMLGTRPPEVNERIGTEELLLLHNFQNRLADEKAPLLKSLSELPPNDPCVQLASTPNKTLTDAERQELEQHRTDLWNRPRLKEEMDRRLLNRPITLLVPEKGRDHILFPKGSDHPTDPNAAAGQIKWIKTILAGAQADKRPIVRIRIEGHTDSDAIHTTEYPDNWVLSSRRAIWLGQSITKALASTPYRSVLVEPIGYADRVPAGTEGNSHATMHFADDDTIRRANSNDGKKQRNRRIRIVLEQN